MKIKKIISAVLGICVLSVGAVAPLAAEKGGFSVISMDCPQAEELWENDYQSYSHLMLRYKDNKQPIPLSAVYDGKIFATVPKENVNRETEIFIAEDLEFTDYNEEYEFYPLTILSGKGVITGNDEGQGLPYTGITRAEAVAMVMRLLGVDNDAGSSSGFIDVPEDAWYSGVITKAAAMGLVEGDSETEFNPERSVSREEMVVMTARAAWCAGLVKEKKEITSEALKEIIDLEDISSISDWALSAYGTMEYLIPMDIEYSDTEVDSENAPLAYYYAIPQKNASRFEAAELIMRLCDSFQIYPSETAVKYGFDKEMPVIDGSTSTYPFTEAVYNSLFLNGYRHPDKPEKHSKSHASYQRLINGEVDMIFASVYPAEDILQMAEENGVELELIPIAYDAMIFFTNINNSAENLTTEQISQIYVNNAYENWKEIGGPDALLYPYCRNNDSGSHAQMQRHFLNGNEINEKIRTETTSITMSNVLTDVMGAETDDPKGYGLGYSIYYYFNNMDLFYNTKSELKLLSINGIAPTDETIADGTYPLSNNTYIAVRKDEPENSPARRMAEFMLTEAGQQCVAMAGFGPLKPLP